jgi:hypothetical protein
MRPAFTDFSFKNISDNVICAYTSKLRFGETPKPTRETRALPETQPGGGFTTMFL